MDFWPTGIKSYISFHNNSTGNKGKDMSFPPFYQNLIKIDLISA